MERSRHKKKKKKKKKRAQEDVEEESGRLLPSPVQPSDGPDYGVGGIRFNEKRANQICRLVVPVQNSITPALLSRITQGAQLTILSCVKSTPSSKQFLTAGLRVTGAEAFAVTSSVGTVGMSPLWNVL